MAYNGWSNYETWNVALWIGNEEGSQREVEEWAEEAWKEAEADKIFSREEVAVLDLEKRIQEMIEDGNPLASSASLYSDLLGAAIGEVDFHEIAEHYIEDVDKDEEAEEDEDEDEDEEAEEEEGN
jgi:hypothetical protein